MSIDFDDPTTWDQPMTQADAISIGIFALNTLAHPEGSNDAQFAALDFFTEGAIEILAKVRDEETWVVETIYNTDPDGRPTTSDDWSNRTLHGPFAGQKAADEFLENFLADDTDVRDMGALLLNKPLTN